MAPLPDEREAGTPVRVPASLAIACRWMAVAGGLVLLAVLLMTVTSIAMRTILGAPIPGDFEMVEMGCAIAVFAFLPWCQVQGGNVLVDFFTRNASGRVNHRLEAAGDLIFCAVAVLLLWRLSVGAAEFYARGESSMVLRLPKWWGFVLILPAVALLALTCLCTMIGHLRAGAGRGA